MYQHSCLGYEEMTITQRVRLEPSTKKLRGNAKIRAVKKLESSGLVKVVDYEKMAVGSDPKSVLHIIGVKLTDYGNEYCGAKLTIK